MEFAKYISQVPHHKYPTTSTPPQVPHLGVNTIGAPLRDLSSLYSPSVKSTEGTGNRAWVLNE